MASAASSARLGALRTASSSPSPLVYRASLATVFSRPQPRPRTTNRAQTPCLYLSLSLSPFHTTSRSPANDEDNSDDLPPPLEKLADTSDFHPEPQPYVETTSGHRSPSGKKILIPHSTQNRGPPVPEDANPPAPEGQALTDLLERQYRIDTRSMLEKDAGDLKADIEKLLTDTGFAEAMRRSGKQGMQNIDEEEDEDLVTGDPDDEDYFREDDILSMAHLKLEEHREYRAYGRIMAWEMPLLAKLAKKYESPGRHQVLRFRHTTYMGELHPAEKKVVVEFCPDDIFPPGDAEDAWMNSKLKKLAGVRYNPEKNIIKMSCESFEHAAQNKRRLGDLVKKLVVEASDPTDKLLDVPIDTRHHRIKTKPKFPTSWRMTPERASEIDSQRALGRQLDRNTLDGIGVIDTSTGSEKPTTWLPTGGKQAPGGVLSDGPDAVEVDGGSGSKAGASAARERVPEMVWRQDQNSGGAQRQHPPRR
ncbi:hypothetical protein MKZ38_001425 [Zalerion maritima]|uniref:Small ribosomal subunit protein mS35 mitochondrial conserved domain-containing protein n=1 Tax=Zalerion maritima TaxID=339359 RepID=A0AAD5RQB5_9PEZI|nr:hypothetical protein MKZ38_001425 [Zalerion maritima]